LKSRKGSGKPFEGAKRKPKGLSRFFKRPGFNKNKD
jgi:hypothetical protein